MAEENKPTKLNVYQKLQKCRAELSKKKLTKSGKNSYSNYKYFELGDFLPIVNELFYENGLAGEFNMHETIATLKIIDVEDTKSQIVFKTPLADASIKGSTPIQSLGGQITYLRRYLYINALEIAENDEIDQRKQETPEMKELKIIYSGKVDSLVAETGTDYEDLNNHFGVKKSSDLDLQQLKMAIKILEAKKQKNKEEVF